MVYLIGAGPGNPELITVKGLRLLQKCDAVIYDRLLSEELLSVKPGEYRDIFTPAWRRGSFSTAERENPICFGAGGDKCGGGE